MKFLEPITDSHRRDNHIEVPDGKRDLFYVIRELGRAKLKMVPRDKESYVRRP